MQCNHDLGKIEEDFFRRVAFSLDPNIPESKSLMDRALRSVNAEAGKNPDERRIRSAVFQRMHAEMLKGTDIPQSSIHPGMGERWGCPVEEQVAIVMPTDRLQRIAEKIVRGIFYLEYKVFIEPPFTVTCLEGNKEITSLISQFGQPYAREASIAVRRAVTQDSIGSLFEIEFWQQFKVYAAVTDLHFKTARKR